MLKGPSGDHFTLKGADTRSGMLATKYDGKRPAASRTAPLASLPLTSNGSSPV
jgi:hypothetical protein